MKRFVFDTADTDNVSKLGVGEWSLNLNHQISCSKICVSNIIIPHTFYNINSTNNLITIKYDDGSSKHLRLPEQYMNFNDMESKINSIQVNGKTDIACDFDKKTFKWKINRVNVNVTEVQFTTSYKLFGFEKNVFYPVDSEALSPYVADMNTIPAVYIRCNQIYSKFVYNNSRTSILHRLPVDKPFGQLLTYQNNSTDMFINQANIGYIQFTLTDNKGNHIDLNNADWKLELLLID